MNEPVSRPRRRVLAAITIALASLASAFGFSVVEAEPASAATCSLVYVTTQSPIIERSSGHAWVTGRARVTNTNITSGCRLRVCVYEELGTNNWYASGCTSNIIARSESTYLSFRLSFPCDIYKGTGRVRSYARFDGSSVSEAGPISRVC